MLPRDLEAILTQVRLLDPKAARARLGDLAGDQAETMALARLASRLTDSLRSCPDPDGALKNLDRFVHSHGSRWQLYQLFDDLPATFHALLQTISSSQYLADVLVRNPEYFELLFDSTLLSQPRGLTDIRSDLRQTCAPFDTRANKLNAVRRFRRREILRIGAADLQGLFDLRSTVQQVSLLADAVVAQSLSIVSQQGDYAGLIVFALGKLGGSELNYSSDIDLIFVTKDRDGIEPSTPIARSLTEALSEFSAEGFLYRVDLRLRPYGSSGSLVVSADAFVDYLSTKAHPAERQAMLKARPIAGDLEAGQEILEQIEPVILADTGTARREVRELKSRIERQLHSRGGSAGHVKLAPGGIRDVEFIVQALQLEQGRVHPKLRTGNTLDALGKLTSLGMLKPEDELQLRDAYTFLRTVEHRLQLMDNQQVHQLPEDERELQVLARILGFCQPNEAQQCLASYRAHVAAVRAVFDRVLPQ